METYQILKNGEPVGLEGELQSVLEVIRIWEKNLDRDEDHMIKDSPYTIGRVCEGAWRAKLRCISS